VVKCSARVFPRKTRPLIALAGVAIGSFSSRSTAATHTWIGGSDNWSNTADWSGGVLPADGDSVQIINSDGVSRIVNYDYTGPAATFFNLQIGLSGGTSSSTNTLTITNDLTVQSAEQIGWNGSGTVNQSGGTNTVTKGSLLLGPLNGSTGVYNLSGTGTITGAGLIFVGAAAAAGSGTFDQTGGTVDLTNITSTSLGGVSVESGSYTLDSGTMTCCAESMAANSSGNTAAFTQNGGTNTVGTPTKGGLFVGNLSGPAGSYTFNAGTLTCTGVRVAGAGVFTQNGGTNNIIGNASSSGHLDIYAGSSFTLNGGTLNAPVMDAGGTFSMTGGTLTSNFEDALPFSQSGGQATFQTLLDTQISLTGGELTLFPNGANSLYPDPQLSTFAVGGTGILNLELGGYTQGVNYDWEHATTSMSLGGTLDLDLENAFVPHVGDQFTILSLSGGLISGSFSQLTSDDPGLTYMLTYTGNTVIARITSVPEPAFAIGFVIPGAFLFRRRTR
jgi:hypothetical protein